MTQATAIAKSDTDLTNVDDSNLFGCGLPDFKPVHTTLEAVAKLLRYQCAQFDGGWDATEFDNMCYIARRKFLIMG